MPFPFDGLFVDQDPTSPSYGSLTGTLNIPNTGNVPFVTQANLQDGYSTVASIFTDFIGFVNFPTPTAGLSSQTMPGLLVINSSNGQPLVQGTDYTVQTSTAIDDDVNFTGTPFNLFRTRLLIEPLKPLAP